MSAPRLCGWVGALLFSGMAMAAGDTTVAPPLKVYVAGSASGALKELAADYQRISGQAVVLEAGPAGLLRERIEQGEPADVFISANLSHPQALGEQGRANATMVFARNQLCVMALPTLGLRADNVIATLLKPSTRIGTSTPGADPGGDYAWAWFASYGASHPGARQSLESRAQKLVGGREAPAVPPGVNAVKYFLTQHKVDVFFAYCSSHQREADPELVKVPLPSALSLPVDYGMTVLRQPQQPARELAAWRLAGYLLSPSAQQQLSAYGFVPVAINQPGSR